MPTLRRRWPAAVVAVLWACVGGAPASAAPEAAAPTPSEALQPILQTVPWQGADQAEKMAAALAALGEDEIERLADLIAPAGVADDSKARYALHGLAVHVARPGAEPERLRLCRVLRGRLDGPAEVPVKAFFLRQLRLMGCPAAVPAIRGVLSDERLCAEAAAALVSIGGPEAAAALRETLPQAAGPHRAVLIQSLGALRDAPSVDLLKKDAADADRDVRLAAWYALGEIGDPAAIDVLAKAAEGGTAYERAAATDSLLLLARRLGEAGRKGEAAGIYRNLWVSRTDAEQRHVRCAAIQGLAAVEGTGAMGDLVAALGTDDPQVRAAAVEAAVAMPGDDVTRRWIEHMASVPAAGKVGLLGLLGRRGGDAAREAVLAALRDRDETVRVAALETLRCFRGSRAVPHLLTFLASESGRERDTARQSLERIPGGEASAAVASALPAVSPGVRRRLLGVLTARGARDQADAVLAAVKDEDPGVREAALDALEVLGDAEHVPTLVNLLVEAKDDGTRAAAEKTVAALCAQADRDRCVESLLPALAAASTPARAALVRVLRVVPTGKALEAVRQATRDEDEAVREAGVRTLSVWPDPAAAPDLLALAKGAESRSWQVLALRGYVRLVKGQGRMPGDEKAALYRQALEAAGRTEEKRLILAALGEAPGAEAVGLLMPALDDETLREEAAAAVVQVGRALGGEVRREPLRGLVVPAMRKVLEVSGNDSVRHGAEQVLREAESE